MLKRSMVLTAVITLLMVVAAPALAGAPVPGASYEFEWGYGQDGLSVSRGQQPGAPHTCLTERLDLSRSTERPP